MTAKHLAAIAAVALSLTACRAETSSASAVSGISSQQGLAIVPLTIRTAAGKTHAFRIEVAATTDQQATGLMFIDKLGPDVGMIFPFVPPRPASFWMKNTLIPLDMIFVRPDCSIARVAVNTEPNSLDPVAVEEPVAAVLEIAGGRSVELGISEGDCVTWPGGPTPQG